MQILIRQEAFPEGFGQKSREYVLSQFDSVVAQIKRYENTIPEKMWVAIPEADITGYLEVFRQSRIRLRDKGIYNAKMLKLMRLLRCKKSPQQPECSAKDKE